VLVPLVALAIVMGIASPVFTRRIEPSADALVRHVKERTQRVEMAIGGSSVTAPSTVAGPATARSAAAGLPAATDDRSQAAPEAR
jgi:hypothetical protein